MPATATVILEPSSPSATGVGAVTPEDFEPTRDTTHAWAVPTSTIPVDGGVSDGRKQDFSSSSIAHAPPSSLLPNAARWAIGRPREYPRYTLTVTHRFEGVVIAIDAANESFTARLMASSRDEELEAEFSIDDVSDDDRELLKQGAWFYLSTGYVLVSGRRKSKVSGLRFRRLPKLQQDDLASMMDEARRRSSAIEFDVLD
jgi:hypothetical protein